jgi:hypothetical protein
MPFIDQSDLVQNMTPEQRIFVSGFYSQFNNRSAANRQILNVDPLYYHGGTAGSEFLTYAATKLYLCLFLNFAGSIGGLLAYVQTHNEANTPSHVYTSTAMSYNTTTPIMVYIASSLNIQNVYFSRFINVNYTYMTFIGYRITLV